MKARAVCDWCNKSIGEDEEIFYRKPFRNDEDFCSKKCLEEAAMDDLEVRKR